jgi:hypothetical protein
VNGPGLLVGVLFLGIFFVTSFSSERWKTPVRLGTFAAVGYVGAALFYGYLVGINAQTPLTCPLCPNILSTGAPVNKLVLHTGLLGTLNAILFVLVGSIFVTLVRLARRILKGDSAS